MLLTKNTTLVSYLILVSALQAQGLGELGSGPQYKPMRKVTESHNTDNGVSTPLNSVAPLETHSIVIPTSTNNRNTAIIDKPTNQIIQPTKIEPKPSELKPVATSGKQVPSDLNSSSNVSQIKENAKATEDSLTETKPTSTIDNSLDDVDLTSPLSKTSPSSSLSSSSSSDDLKVVPDLKSNKDSTTDKEAESDSTSSDGSLTSKSTQSKSSSSSTFTKSKSTSTEGSSAIHNKLHILAGVGVVSILFTLI